MEQLHTIQKLQLCLRLGGEEGAYAIQQRIGSYVGKELEQAILHCFEQLAPTNEELMIDRLELNLGVLEANVSYEDFSRAFMISLRQSLSTLVAQASGSSSERVRRVATREATMMRLERLLVTGRGGWTSHKQKSALAELFWLEIDANPVVLAHQLKVWLSISGVADRLAKQLSRDLRLRVLQLYSSLPLSELEGRMSALLEGLEGISNCWKGLPSTRLRRESDLAAWLFALEHCGKVLRLPVGILLQAYLRSRGYKHVNTTFSLEEVMLLSALFWPSSKGFWSGVSLQFQGLNGEPRDLFWRWMQAGWIHLLAILEVENLDSYGFGKSLLAFLGESVSFQPGQVELLEAQRSVIRLLSNDEICNWEAERDALQLLVPEMDELGVGLEVSPIATNDSVEFDGLMTPPPVNGDANDGKQDVELSRRLELLTSKRRPADFGEVKFDVNTLWDEDGNIYLENAGLVLLNPFFKYCFADLGWMEQNDFVNEEAREDAVLLMAYMASGALEVCETELILPKLLCGMDISQPVRYQVDLPPVALGEADELLLAANQYWERAGKLNPDQFRNSFLIRDGRLTQSSNGWELKVDRRSHDILLDYLPWSFATLRLPWMQKIIHVDW